MRIINDLYSFVEYSIAKMTFRIIFIISILITEILKLRICMKTEIKEITVKVKEEITEISAGDENTPELLFEEFKTEIISESNTEINNYASREVPPHMEQTNNNKRKRSPSEDPSFSTRSTDEEIDANDDRTPPEGKIPFGYYCDVCQVHFRFGCAYEDHLRVKHSDKKPYRCSQCNSSYGKKQNYVQHLLQFHPDVVDFDLRRKFQEVWCKLCDTEHVGMFALQKHCLTDHKGVKTFECEDCEARYFRNYELMRHKRNRHYQDAGNPFRCKHCKNLFQRSDDLKDHQAACVKIRGIMKATGNRQGDILLPPDVKKSKDEDIRKKSCLKSPSAEELQRRERGINYPKTKRIFRCDTWYKKAFTSDTKLGIHVNKYRANSEEMVRKEKHRVQRVDVIYDCHVCGEAFRYASKCVEHFRTRHPDYKPFVCDVCRGGYSSKWGLSEHVQKMHGSESFSCTYCTKCFSLKREVERHEKGCGKKKEIRGRRGSFFCEICIRWLEGSSKAHKFNHEDYEYCEFCERRFHKENNPTGLSTHVLQRHSNRLNVGVKVWTNTTDIKGEGWED